jgi:hypothetical protein
VDKCLPNRMSFVMIWLLLISWLEILLWMWKRDFSRSICADKGLVVLRSTLCHNNTFNQEEDASQWGPGTAYTLAAGPTHNRILFWCPTVAIFTVENSSSSCEETRCHLILEPRGFKSDLRKRQNKNTEWRKSR